MRPQQLLAAAAVVLAAACAGTSDPLPPDVTVVMELNRTSLSPQDTLVIKVTGINTSDHSIQVPNYPCLANIDVRNDRNERVNLGDPIYCILPLYPPRVIAPADTWGDQVRIYHPGAGEYRIRGGLPVMVADGFVFSDFRSVSVRP